MAADWVIAHTQRDQRPAVDDDAAVRVNASVGALLIGHGDDGSAVDGQKTVGVNAVAFGAQTACQSAFMAMGQARTSLFLALLRKVILLVPLALFLPWAMGDVMGIYIAEPVADALASATTLTLFLFRRRELLPLDKK